MQRSTLPWVRVALAAAVLAGVGYVLTRPPHLREGVLANAPATSMGVARVTPEALFASPLWRDLVVARGGDRGLRRLREQCGFDPADALEEVMIFVLGTDARSLDHVVFVGRGEFERGALGECMREIVESQGGGLRRTEIEGVPAIAGRRGESRMAFLGDEGVIFGLEEAVAEVIRTVRGERSLAADEAFASAWAAVAPHADVAVVAKVPPGWRGGLGVAAGALAPALEGLELVAVGAELREGLRLRVHLRYGPADRVGEVASWAERRRAALAATSREPLESALRAVQIDGGDGEVTVTLRLPSDVVEALAHDLATTITP